MTQTATGPDAFRAHLDKCERCAKQPFNLCSTGAALLQSAASTLPGIRPLIRSQADTAPRPNDNMPHGDLVVRLRFCASALNDAVNGDEVADEAAKWFNIGFLATAAKVIREAADALEANLVG